MYLLHTIGRLPSAQVRKLTNGEIKDMCLHGRAAVTRAHVLLSARTPICPSLPRRASGVLFLLACLVCGGCASANEAIVPTNTQLENAQQGADAIGLTNAAKGGEIEGFASAVSVNHGEETRFYVSTVEPSYSLQVFRVGWYSGKGARAMTQPILRAGIRQPAPVEDAETGLIECHWSDPYILKTSDAASGTPWPSGVYVAKLTASASGKQSYIIFVVRDDASTSDLLFQTSVTTYEAYNDWGGKSLYTKPRAHKVSFNRPYKQGYGTGHFLFWELSMVRFLEREGYDVSYTTDVDTHERGNLLLQHKAFLSVGHDEYWSWRMRDHVQAARDLGVNLGFFGADAAYWQIRFEPSLEDGAPDRTITCYKDADKDPFSGAGDAAMRRLTTVKFRDDIVNRPEDELVGVMYETDPVGGDIVIEDDSSWVFAGTGLKQGDHLKNLLGYEVDRMFGHAPKGTTRLSHSPYQFHGETRYSDMTVYTAPSGATVFATGSMQWNWGLNDYEVMGQKYANQAVQQVTRNILSRFGAAPATPSK